MVVLIGAALVVLAATAFVLGMGSIVRLVDDDRRGVPGRRSTKVEINAPRWLTPESSIRVGAVSFIAGLIGIYLLVQLAAAATFVAMLFAVLGIVLMVHGEQARHVTDDR